MVLRKNQPLHLLAIFKIRVQNQSLVADKYNDNLAILIATFSKMFCFTLFVLLAACNAEADTKCDSLVKDNEVLVAQNKDLAAKIILLEQQVKDVADAYCRVPITSSHMSFVKSLQRQRSL